MPLTRQGVEVRHDDRADIGGLYVPLVWLVFLYWAYKAYQGVLVNIPVVTNFIKGQGWA